MTTTTTLTSELEAINTLLRAAGHAPVQTIVGTGLAHVAEARDTLNEVSRTIQGVGWSFNTEYDYELTRDSITGYIVLPGDTLRFDAQDNVASKSQPQARGLRLYDAKRATFVFDENVKGTLVRLLEWDSLPQAARHYIMISAARTFQVRTLGSDSRERFKAEDEQNARMAMGQYESETSDANMLYDSRDTYAIIRERDQWPW